MIEKRFFLDFLKQLVLYLVIGFTIHIIALYLLEQNVFDHLIIQAYSVNLLLALSSVFILIKAKKKYNNSLGFIFMGISMLKFILFFIFFQPVYKADDKMSAVEFIAFFTPYSIALIVEILALSRILNKDKAS